MGGGGERKKGVVVVVVLMFIFTYRCLVLWDTVQGGGDTGGESDGATGGGGGGFGFARGGDGPGGLLFSRDGLFKLAGYAAVAYVGTCVCICIELNWSVYVSVCVWMDGSTPCVRASALKKCVCVCVCGWTHPCTRGWRPRWLIGRLT